MKLYIDYSAEIYGIYLKYISSDDIHIYSIDEAFLDVTHYLSLYKMTARQLWDKIRADILDTVGITAACGIGTNLYLAKVALDITAKHSKTFCSELDEEKYKTLRLDPNGTLGDREDVKEAFTKKKNQCMVLLDLCNNVDNLITKCLNELNEKQN